MKPHLAIMLATSFLATPLLAQPGPWAGNGYGMGGGYGQNWNGPGMMQGPGYGGMQGQGYGPMSGGWFGPGWGPDISPGWRNPNAPGRGRFASIDANEDGVISDEEAASQADMIFTVIDANDDGSLTIEEFMAVRMGPQVSVNPDREAAMQARKAARFDPMDADKNGSVSKSEFIATSKAHFDSADTNGDGKVSPWEMRSRDWN